MVVLRGLGELFLRISIFDLMTRASSSKIENLSSRMRLAASERSEIPQIGSLARRKRIFPAIFPGLPFRWKGLEISSPSGWVKFSSELHVTEYLDDLK